MAALRQELAESQRNLKRETDRADFLQRQVEAQAEWLDDRKPTQHCPPELHSLGTQAHLRRLNYDLSQHLRRLSNIVYWKTSSAICRVERTEEGWQASELLLNCLEEMRDTSYEINIRMGHQMKVSLGQTD
jgi:hypothetical protein